MINLTLEITIENDFHFDKYGAVGCLLKTCRVLPFQDIKKLANLPSSRFACTRFVYFTILTADLNSSHSKLANDI